MSLLRVIQPNPGHRGVSVVRILVKANEADAKAKEIAKDKMKIVDLMGDDGKTVKKRY